jgi:hypothetical protein
VVDFLLPGTVRAVTSLHDPGAAEALGMALDLFDIDAVHIHNIKGQSLAPLHVLRDFDGPVVCSVHDLYLACPHYSLLYRDADPCGIPDDLAVCGRCLPETEDRSLDQLEAFRATVAAGVARVDRWVLPSQSAADYLLRAYDVDPGGSRSSSTLTIDRAGRWLDEGLVLDEPLRWRSSGWAKKGLGAVNHLAEALATPTWRCTTSVR